MADLRQTDRLGKIPLGSICDSELGSCHRSESGNPSTHSCLLATDHNRPVGFQVTDVGTFLGVNMVLDRCIGEVAIEGKVTWDLLTHNPVNQLFGKLCMVLEGVLVVRLVTFAEAPKVKRVMLAS